MTCDTTKSPAEEAESRDRRPEHAGRIQDKELQKIIKSIAEDAVPMLPYYSLRNMAKHRDTVNHTSSLRQNTIRELQLDLGGAHRKEMNSSQVN